MDSFGFLKVAAAVPHVRVGDCDFNAERMAAMADEAAQRGVEIVAFPELALTAYTCGDLLLQPALLDAADEALARLVRDTRKLPLTMIAGPVAPRTNALQLRRGLHAGAHTGRRPQNLYPRLYGILREPLVRIGRRHLRRDDPRRGAGCGFRRRPHVRGQRHGVRRGAVRRPLDGSAALVAHGTQRREGDLQPLGIARGRRQARLPAAARSATVGTHDRGLCLLLGRLRRIIDRPGIRRERHHRRKREDPARSEAFRARRAVGRGRPRHRTAGIRTPQEHLVPRE